MSPDRWQKIERLYEDAVALAPERRAAFLQENCAGEESLRHDLESLLFHGENAGRFLEDSPLATRRVPVLRPGSKLGSFEILGLLGKGGMGEVYRARDLRLGRDVAIKVLPPEIGFDAERAARFEREARAASALNHPNILSVYDIGRDGDVSWMVCELVEGQSLRQVIATGPIPPQRAMEIAAQMADGLAAAHAAGIVHRDLKPENVMLTGDGRVKVLDFGVAKWHPRTRLDFGLARLTERGAGMEPSTEEGAILGTAAYMSPEQAEGKTVDPRSDIFSFGSLLYEMATGRRAFGGETAASTLVAILRDEPKAVREVTRGSPRQLDWVIERCLRKSPEGRFQSMAEVKAALEELKKGSLRRRSVLRRAAWVAGAMLLAAAMTLPVWLALSKRMPPGPPVKVSMLAAQPGCQWSPALSPDGRQVVFVWSRERREQHNIYVQLVGDAAPRQLTNDAAFEYSPVWSPDALHIAFLRETVAGTEVILIPAAGGVERRLHTSQADCRMPQRIVTKQACGLAWSPDGKFLAIVDRESPQDPNSVYQLDVHTLQTRRLTTPPRGFEDGLSVFSPDGRNLAFARRPGLPLSDIYLLPISASGSPRGEPRRVTRDNVFILGFDWTEDGSGIVFSSSRGGVFALWQVAASGGEPQRLAFGGSDGSWPSLSRTGGRMAFAAGAVDDNIWRVAAPGSGVSGAAAHPLRITQSPVVDQDAVFSPDGRKIAFSSMLSGSHQIWICESDGSHTMQLTDLLAPGADAPAWSPDGRQIAFRGHSPGPRHVAVIGVDGGAPHRLTTGEFDEDPPAWSHDGKWIYFGSDRGNGEAIWKVAAAGGPAIRLSPTGRWPLESLDGKFVYYHRAEGIWKVPSDGGPPVLAAPRGGWPFYESADGKTLYYSGADGGIWKGSTGGHAADLLVKRGEKGRARWVLFSTGFYLLDPDARGGPAITRFSLAGARERAIRLPGGPDEYAEASGDLSLSPDERWLLYPRQDRTDGVIMLVENLRRR